MGNSFHQISKHYLFSEITKDSSEFPKFCFGMKIKISDALNINLNKRQVVLGLLLEGKSEVLSTKY